MKHTQIRKAESGGIRNGFLQNPSIHTGGVNQSDFVLNSTEKTENLQAILTENLQRSRKIIRLHTCFGCGKPKAPAKFSIYYGVCKECLRAAKDKGKTAQSNFIARTINNFHKNLRGALQNA